MSTSPSQYTYTGRHVIVTSRGKELKMSLLQSDHGQTLRDSPEKSSGPTDETAEAHRSDKLSRYHQITSTRRRLMERRRCDDDAMSEIAQQWSIRYSGACLATQTAKCHHAKLIGNSIWNSEPIWTVTIVGLMYVRGAHTGAT